MTLSVLLALAFNALTTPTIFAYGNIDQYKLPYGGTPYYFPYPFYSNLKQEFTPRKNNIIGVDLYINNLDYATNKYFQITISGPGVSVTKTAYVSIPSGYSWVHIDFDSPIPLTRYKKYQIIPWVSGGIHWIANGYSHADYSGGVAWIGWNPNSNLDFCFRTYYDPDFDSTPPIISISGATPDLLWPPNHKLQDVEVDVYWSDNIDPSPIVQVSVTSNESVNDEGTGDGNTEPDWIIVDPHHLKLRAERDGTGNDRIYTITYTVTDAAGNSATASTTVTVPHDKSK